MAQTTFDLIVVGGGIVGTATALALTRAYPGLKLAILEKEDHLAAHQTGHNSGVIHSGLYYRPGSLKAQNCAAGREALYAFCAERNIAHGALRQGRRRHPRRRAPRPRRTRTPRSTAIWRSAQKA